MRWGNLEVTVPSELCPFLTDGADYCLLRGILQGGHSVGLHAPVHIRLPPGLPQGEDAATPGQHAYLTALRPRHARFTFPEAVRSWPVPQASARAAGVPQYEPHRVVVVVLQKILWIRLAHPRNAAPCPRRRSSGR
ncbi:hypothetical protein DFH09DRAFT_1092966 [Mycena vulgaris]|nr:hypothetical protein DFH09DRAFT_1092966 [Mycena vulgaris]